MKKLFLAGFVFASLVMHLAAEGCAAAAQKHPVLFYSGRGENKDVYILHPGAREPRNLTNHPSWDVWASFVPNGKAK